MHQDPLPTPRVKGKPRGIRRDRDCLKCRSRKVKCDLNRPECGQCANGGYKCPGYPIRVRWASDPEAISTGPISRHGLASTSATAGGKPLQIAESEATQDTSTFLASARGHTAPPGTALSRLELGGSSNWTTHLANYLEYFSSKYAQARAVRCEQEGLDYEDDHDINGIWTFAWRQISQRLQGGTEEEGCDQDQLYADALHGLTKAVECSNILAIFGITTLAFLDVQEGPFGQWTRHLKGARALLDLHCQGYSQLLQLYASTPGLKQAVSLLNWYDVMGQLVHQDRRLVFEDFHRIEMEETLFDLVACPRATFCLYVQIAQGRMTSFPHQIYHSVTSQLLQVSCSFDDQHLLLQDAWRYATFHAALECLHPDGNENTKEASALVADKICDLIDKMDPLESTYVHLPVPVFFMGIHASTERHLRVADSFWSHFDSLSLPSYPYARSLYEERRQRRQQAVLA